MSSHNEDVYINFVCYRFSHIVIPIPCTVVCTLAIRPGNLVSHFYSKTTNSTYIMLKVTTINFHFKPGARQSAAGIQLVS